MNDVPFVRTPEPVVRRMLELCQLKPKELVYDLGSGDGRILIMAAREFGARAVGVEIREDLVKQTEKKIRKLGLEKSIKIIQGSFFDVDLGEADVVTLYLLTSVNSKLRPKLEKELKKGTRIVSHDFKISGWEPAKKEKLKHWLNHTIFLYYWKGAGSPQRSRGFTIS